MFQWFYDLFATYILPLIVSVMQFLGIDSKKVSFDTSVKGGSEEALEDAPPVEQDQ